MNTCALNSMLDLLCCRAERQRNVRGYTFLVKGEREGPSLTYGALDQRSREIAVTIWRSLAPGERALLMYPPGLEFIAAFFGCLYAGVVAVPAYPPHPARLDRDLARLRAIVADAQVGAVLGTEEILVTLPTVFGNAPELAGLSKVTTDCTEPGDCGSWERPNLDPDSLAFLQYTSGSTAAPKGVMVSHGNLLRNLAYIQQRTNNDAGSVGVSWLPPYHDMGLIEGILQPLFGGYPTYLMAPQSFVQKPVRWLGAISRYRATNSGGPNFAYDLCARKITTEQRRELNLSSWRIAYNGAEPIRRETLESFQRIFCDCGFRRDAFTAAYGLAEATLMVSCAHRGNSRSEGLIAGAVAGDQLPKMNGSKRAVSAPVSCGKTSLGTEVVIADPDEMTRMRPGEVGEIWVSSPSVARGYWNHPKETDRTFRAYLAETKQGPFLRTGDLGFVMNGELFATGRLKDVIIVRGRKHYPQDLEYTIESSHPAIRRHCTAAFSLPTAEGERVMVVAELHPRNGTGNHRLTETPQPDDVQAGLEEVIATIRRAVAHQHELQICAVTLLSPGSVPRTSSGKIQRHACRKGFLAGNLGALAQWVQLPKQIGASG